jgi:ATP-dependent Lhr-like helicase
MLSAVPPSLAWAHSLVQEWFVSRFGTPTEPQKQGWPHILAGHTTLIAAPTGSGKTLAAFLACIDRLVRKALAGQLTDRTEVLYVSPLKALGNDIQKNLEIPLGEILQMAAERGLLMPEIRTAVRTGDTLAKDRRLMLKRPPHILVTTPESLYILLTAEKSRAILRDVETVIVDEIHAVADDKRGVHLALSLERLEALTERAPVRIGLSATQKPIDEVARFLAGNSDEHWPRPEPVIVDVGHKRKMDLAIEVPASELGPVASNEMWDEIYGRIVELVNSHRSTLLFVNTRRLAERIAHQLGERLGEENVAAHHGSLSRKLRLEAERRLKEGQIKVLVATASLELGIDVGTVDLVCHISSPRSIAVALQRVGRSGHWRGAIPKGRFFVTTRDDLAECAVLVRSIRSGDLDRLIFPEGSLDVMAQQIVACCAVASGGASGTASDGPPNDGSGDGWDEDALFALVKRAYPYRNLSRAAFDSVIDMLSEGIAAQRGRYGAYLHHDRINRKLRARRGARLAAITSGGAIPDNALFTVVAEPDGAAVGTVDEDFAVESMAGDIMLLGNTSWRIRRVEGKSSRVLVEDAHGSPPTVPFWRGEAPARTAELSRQLGELRQDISDRLKGVAPVEGWRHLPVVAETVAWLGEECGLDQSGAEQLIQYVIEGRAVLGQVPTQTTIIAERFFDEGGGMQLVIHAPFGGRINKAWGLALRKRFCRGFNFELQAAATDNGLNVALAEQHSFPLADVFQFLHSETMAPILEQAALVSPIFGTRWRWDATRALALLRFQGGKKVPPQIQRIRSDDLLASVFPDVAACGENIVGDIKIPDHPLIAEVMKDVLTEALDIDGLGDVLRGIEQGRIRCVAVDTPVPSQFSHEILNANPYAYLDDAPLEERRARAVEMRRVLPASVLEEVGALDPAAIAQVQAEAWPDVRDADELHDVLHTLVAVPTSSQFSVVSSQEGSSQVSGVGSQENRLPYIGLADGDLPCINDSVGRAELVARGSTLVCDWEIFFERLLAARRAFVAQDGGRKYWVAAERTEMWDALHPNARVEASSEASPTIAEDAAGRVSTVGFDDSLLAAVQGWMTHLGPTTASEVGDLIGVPAAEVEKALLRIEASGAILRGQFRPRELKPESFGQFGGTRTGVSAPHETVPHETTRVSAAHPSAQNEAETEWCGRRLLARIHRLTVATLRKQIEPVTASQFMNWLLRWQHIAPGSEVRGEHGTLEVIRQLQGFEVPANTWERFVLGRRILDYEPGYLDQLCLAGVVGWGRLSPHPVTLEAGSVADRHGSGVAVDENGEATAPHRQRRVIPTRVAPIAFFVREESDWMSAHPAHADDSEMLFLSPVARELYELMKERGALFFPDMVRATGRLKAEVETGLWELVAVGLVTADGFENLRALVAPKSSGSGVPGSAGLRVAGFGKTRRPRHAAGRWSLLHVNGLHVNGEEHRPKSGAERDQSVESCCWMLLRRYGVVFRDLLARETNLPRWRDLQIAFRRLEDRGEVRGGRFVDGFVGEQFALPVAVESLRANRRLPMNGERTVIAAADPLNLVGIIVPGERIPAISGRSVTFRDGQWEPEGETLMAAGV